MDAPSLAPPVLSPRKVRMETIGRYQIRKELGRGGMGVVYLAEDPAIGRPVAIKTINLESLSEPDEEPAMRNRLMREARSAGILSHPGIVTIYDVTHTEHLACIVMEYVDGVTLYDRMSKGAFEPAEVLSILEQTAAALDYAHSKGVMHRDIKPANIISSSGGLTKIMDFGVARLTSQKTAASATVLGTPAYMSPEQIGGKTVGPASDQFSLAVLAFEMLAGKKPFHAESISALLYSIISRDPLPIGELNPSLAPAVDRVLRKALAKEPEDRYSNCTEFVRALKEACGSKQDWRPNRTIRGVAASLPQEVISGGPEWKSPEPVRAPEPPPPAPQPPAPKPVAATPPPAPRPVAAPPPAAPKPVSTAAPPAPPARSGHRAAVVSVVAVFAVGCSLILYKTLFSEEAPPEVRVDGLPPASSPEPRPKAGSPTTPAPKAVASQPVPAPAPSPSSPVVGSQPAAQPAAAEPKPGGGVPVEMHTIPPRAKVSVAGQECLTPCTLDLPKGQHYVRAELEGHKPQLQRIQVPQQLELSIRMEPAVGWLDIPGPADATVYVDGKPWARKAPVSIPVAPGPHTIYLQYADGNKSNEQQIVVKEDARYPLTYQ